MNSDLILRTPSGLTTIVRDPFQILSLSGGGFRGLYTATLLEKLEEAADKPLSEVFDLIAGTSIGGILAIGLAAGVKASKLREAFEQNAESIFPRFHKIKGIKFCPRLKTGIFRGRYPQTGLKATVESILSATGAASIQDLKTKILVSSVDVTDNAARIFTSDDQTSPSTPLVDIALATSAAPSYFPEHKLGNNILVDGGLIANAPDMIAVMSVLRTQRLDDVRMVSIGTAGREGGKASRKPRSSGWLTGGKDVFLLTLDAQEQLSVSWTEELLRSHYVRFDCSPSSEEQKVIGLDRTGKDVSETLAAMAARTFKGCFESNRAMLVEMLNRKRAR
jgi:predicted acylesterase/phospholipase RssA